MFGNVIKKAFFFSVVVVVVNTDWPPTYLSFLWQVFYMFLLYLTQIIFLMELFFSFF